MTIFDQIVTILQKNSILYTHKHHQPTPTSEDSARERGEPIEIGGKALLVKVDNTFHLLVISAVRKLDTPKVKAVFQAKSVRFATPEELLQITGLVPWSVPPIGKPLFPYDCTIDESIIRNDKIAFNAWLLTDSIILQTKDWLSCIEYKRADISKSISE